MHILITGAYGFVGSNLSQYLAEQGHTLTALDQTYKELSVYTNFFSWNDFDKIPFGQFDSIIHLAGKAHDTKKQSKADEYFAINTGLTQKVFDAFINSSCKQFFFFSSVKAAADTVEGDVLIENVIPKPKGAYGESKIKAEEYIKAQTNDFQSTKDKKVYIFRPCMIHGAGNKGNLNLLFNFVSKGIPYPLGAYDNKRSFLGVDNLSWIIEKFIVQSPVSGIYHLADDEPVSTNKLIQLIAESQSKKALIWKWNKNFIRFIAQIGNILKLPLNSDNLQKLTENYVVSNAKAKSAIAVSRLPYSAEEGLRKTLKSFG